MSQDSLPQISVVMPTRARADQLARALERLEHQSDAPPFEVVVVSDAADPDPGASRAAVGDRPFDARHLHAALPGASAARNEGWRAARAPLVLFLDDDVLAVPRLLAEHAAGHADAPSMSVGILGRLRWAPELRVTPFMRWMEHGIQFEFHNIEAGQAGWGRFYTGNASVKRALLEAVEGFDHVTFPYLYEDLDLARRAHDAVGFEVHYRPGAVGDHLHAMTVADYARRLGAVAPAERRFVARHPDVRPYFHDLFTEAMRIPAARGRSAALTRFVGQGFPVLGPIAWKSYDMVMRQRLAPSFLAAWDAAGDQPPADGGP